MLGDQQRLERAVPIAWGPAKDQLFATAGGYKYAEFGEGICWLRIPRDTALRPVDTGWFADFAALGAPRSTTVAYGPGGARFSGATFDASPIYRADAKNPLPWMDQMLGAIEHTNFFENRSTEYSKASTKGTWEEAFS